MKIISLNKLLKIGFINKLVEMGFVPSVIIVGGWIYALILALIFLYNLTAYIFQLLAHQDK